MKHYAGDVVYDVTGFVEKNKDVLSDYITETLLQTSHPLLQVLFSSSGSGATKARIVRRGSKISGFSLASQFTEQLKELIFMIDYSTPRYVRCIKPNSILSGRPSDFHEETVKD